MNHPLAARSWRRRSASLALMISAGATLALAGPAAANTYSPTTGPELQSAISAANSNPGADVIKLGEIQYKPTAPMTITGPLEITGDPQLQTVGQQPIVDGSNVQPFASNTFTINPGVNVRFKGFTVTGASDLGYSVIVNQGTIALDDIDLAGNGATIAVNNANGATMSVSDSSLNDNSGGGIANNGTLSVRGTTIAGNVSGGLSGKPYTLVNSIVYNNDIFGFNTKNCIDPPASVVASIDGDGSCAAVNPANGKATNTDPMLEPSDFHGGPTQTLKLSDGSPAIDAGNNANCSTTDQRFFVRSDGACDIGAYEAGAAQDTTKPNCSVSALRNGPPKQQDVKATDAGSGIGADAITNVTIANGSTAYTPPTKPGASLTVTATKTDQSQITRWSFDATDWAGNTTHCQ